MSEHLLAAPRRRVSFLDVSLDDVLEPRSVQRQSRRESGGTPPIVPSRRPSLQGWGPTAILFLQLSLSTQS